MTDSQQRLASPFATYTRRRPSLDAEYLRQFAVAEEIVRFVVGLPVHLDGSESRVSEEARRFGLWLGEQTGLPVEFFDERFSSVEADEQLRFASLSPRQRKERRDMLAAQILLSAFLEARNRQDRSTPGSLDD